MKRIITVSIGVLAIGFLLVVSGIVESQSNDQPPGFITNNGSSTSTADHSRFEILQGPFASGPEVTAACITCHTEASSQLHATLHWTWERTSDVTGQTIGKRHVINNFCIGIASNEQRCTSCHIGYGWRDNTFDFTSETNVDCLVCHDTTGTYEKFPSGAGHPVYAPVESGGKLWEPPDLALIAQNVGPTSRATCGSCHFNGGGADAVKHGDLDSTLANPPFELDVHMSPDRLNFSCATCHAGEAHQIAGSRYELSPIDVVGIDIPGRTDGSRASCESCHSSRPHPEWSIANPFDYSGLHLNNHVEKLACQTCHIPSFARGQATQTFWDWSAAGERDSEGRPVVRRDEQGRVIYDGRKGSFAWGMNVEPVYQWFNGEVIYTTLEEPLIFDVNGNLVINALMGSAEDGRSRIYPMKRFVGIQPYDPVNETLAVPHLFRRGPDDQSAYWGNFDWNSAIAVGMEAAGLPYSGQYDFVQTEMYWPITHMVAPAANALQCVECHTANGESRMANISGVYLPARDQHPFLGWWGIGLITLSLTGVIGHATLRVLASKRRRSSVNVEEDTNGSADSSSSTS